MAKDYIDREAACVALTDYYHHKTQLQLDALKEALNRIPAADVAPVVRGEWTAIRRRESQYDLAGVKTWAVVYRCSKCGFINTVIEDFGHYSFCPQCGATMHVDVTDTNVGDIET